MASIMNIDKKQNTMLGDPKKIEDYSERVTELFAEIDTMDFTVPGALDEATERIVELEKKARQSSDGASGSRLACKLLSLHKDFCDYVGINEWIVVLSKKRSQLKRVIVDMIHLGMEWVQELEDKEVKLALIRTLSSVADGKIFLEVEKARLVLLEVRMVEEQQDFEKAALLLQDVQVEIFTTMEPREKYLYILDQIRLVLMREDYIRCHLISKKFNPVVLNDEEFQDIKVQYYTYLVRLHCHEKDYQAVAEDYWQCFQTPLSKEGEDWKKYLSCYVIYLSMAPRHEDIPKRIQNLCDTELKRLAEIPVIRRLAHDMLSHELVDWPLPYEAELQNISVFSNDASNENWTTFRSRRLQHNVFIISMYYSRITLSSVASMLSTSIDEAEEKISELVYTDDIYARIDRPAGIVTFGKPKTCAEKLDSWTAEISNLLKLVQETTHLINNERMVYAALQKRNELNEKD